MVLTLLHGLTWMDNGAIAHTRGGKYFAYEVGNPITELVMTSRDEANLLTIQGVIDGKSCIASVAVGREVWGIYSVA